MNDTSTYLLNINDNVTTLLVPDICGVQACRGRGATVTVTGVQQKYLLVSPQKADNGKINIDVVASLSNGHDHAAGRCLKKSQRSCHGPRGVAPLQISLCLQAIPFDRGTANYIQWLPASLAHIKLSARSLLQDQGQRTSQLMLHSTFLHHINPGIWRRSSSSTLGPLSIKTDNNMLNPNFGDLATPLPHHPAIQQHFLFFPLQCKAQIPSDQILRKTFIRCIKTDEYAVAYPTSDPQFNPTPWLVSRMTLQDIKLHVESQNQSSASKSFTAPQDFHVETISLQLCPPSYIIYRISTFYFVAPLLAILLTARQATAPSQMHTYSSTSAEQCHEGGPTESGTTRHSGSRCTPPTGGRQPGWVITPAGASQHIKQVDIPTLCQALR
ncbi:hypothetical protein C8R44DRAFT_743037 [Mycena epipterygia]|nr:hypothetical protein C8R44DRAFT_743037 [Mycena epipterygia]